LAGLAGGVLWLTESANLSLSAVQPDFADPAPVAMSGAAPGFTVSATAAASEIDSETRLRRLEAQVQTLSQQLQTQQQRLERSREELAHLAQTLQRQQFGDQIATGDDASTGAEPPSPQAEQARAQERLALLDRQIVGEKIDPRWSGPATEQIRGVFADGALAGSALSSAACQTTLCRVEVDHRDAMALDRFVGEFPARLGWSAHSYSQVTTHEDGSATLVLYISREGYRLPKPEV
jgi:TolA-binding protein